MEPVSSLSDIAADLASSIREHCAACKIPPQQRFKHAAIGIADAMPAMQNKARILADICGLLIKQSRRRYTG